MPDANVRLEDHGLLRRINASLSGGMNARIAALLTKGGARAERDMKKALSGGTLKARSGRLRAGAGFRVSKRARMLAVEVGILSGKEALKYAAVHELGTRGAGGVLPDITPKRAKWLMIPQEAALTSAGVARFSPREASGSYPDIFFIEGDGLLFMFGGRGGDADLLFIGTKRVKIPPRPYIRPAFNSMVKSTKEEIERAMSSLLFGG